MKPHLLAATLLAQALRPACAATAAPATPASQPSPFEAPTEPVARGPIDDLVFARLQALGIRPARPCSDAVFLRRAYLDVIGTLPTAREAREFLLDPAPDKRAALVERLLARDEFADYWALRWCDILRVKAEFPINLWPNAVQAYHRWIRTCIAENVPYDRFARDLLTASGSNFRVPPVNFYRAVQARTPEALAGAAALAFMGTRLDGWPADRVADLALFFARIDYKPTSEWKEEIVLFNSFAPEAAPQVATYPDGTTVTLHPDRDPRELFADWLTAPGNPWFARAAVNRVWSWLLGRGIIHEPDDIRPDNPPTHPELLAWLERELVTSGYDLKHIYRAILNSQTYQLSPIPRSEHPDAEAHFAHYALRRLDAEVLIDALCQITGTTEKYSSPIPEPFTFIPEAQRSIQLADGSITSTFLELFGRPPRDTGLEAERNNRPTAAQRLHLLNSSHIQRKIQQGPRLRPLLQGGGRPRATAESLYLTILSRFPTEPEFRAVAAYAGAGAAGRREAVADVVWALINSGEFLYRH